MTDYVIEGARTLLPSGLAEADLRLEDGIIAEIGAPSAAGAVRIDGRGLLLAPAIIDIHGDAFERSAMPRSNVFFPLDVAILDVDRQLAAAGIATAYHALTLSWEPGLRSAAQGEAFLAGLEATAPRLRVDHRAQLRWEIFAFEAIPLIERALQAPQTPSLAFNDHTSMVMRPADRDLLARDFELDPDYETIPLDHPVLLTRFRERLKRAGLSAEAYRDLLAEIWARRPEVADRLAALAATARAAGAPMLSHDDCQMRARRHYRSLGAAIAEFPMKEAIAREARAEGEAVVLGAPNALRGGSHIGSLSAAEMVEAGLCDVLASDYAYPAMLAAAGRLLAEKRSDLAGVWSLLSAGPARALGLSDRGEIALGKRADLVLLEWPEGATPATRATFSAGRVAYLGADLVRG